MSQEMDPKMKFNEYSRSKNDPILNRGFKLCSVHVGVEGVEGVHGYMD
jgi:hypothetical protein